MHRSVVRFACVSTLGLLAAAAQAQAQAQDRANTILVLDGSGSMWGQIEGVNKIVIARDVVGTILDDFPTDENLGLTVYGHRTRGDCADIETVVAPGTGTAGAIRDVVNGINPRGKTPMTDAVIAAAEALRYTEEAATVILVSDGIETCNPDPCAAARALEQAGIDFTAHVVGFDVTDPEALAQMQCLAEETGGTFTTAANADELTRALRTVTVAAPPDPEPEPVALVPIRLVAVTGTEDGPPVDGPVLWSLSGNDGAVFTDRDGNPLEDSVDEGAYTATAYDVTTETEASAQFVAIGEGPAEVVIVFPEILPQARVIGPASAPLGATIQVGWDGPAERNDYIAVSVPGENGYVNFAYTRDGNPVELQMPPAAGDYELRYVLGDGRDVLASAPIEVTPVAASVSAPDDAATIGTEARIAWTGPDYRSDYIAISEPGENGYLDFAYTRDGSPATLDMPAEPGTYELRYVMNQDRTVLATAPIEVRPLAVAVDGPAEAERGATIPVGWQGPGNDNDYIAVSIPGESDYVNFAYLRDGNPVQLEMPAEPGDYELRYVLNADRSILASAPITVTDIALSVSAPAEAIAGAEVEVSWVGPDYPSDYIAVAEPGDRSYVNFTYTREGNPLPLQMPVTPGSYEIRYVFNQDREIGATTTITVAPLKVTLDAPAIGVAGATIPVDWDGPDYASDYIAVSDPSDDRYVNFTYTRDGNPAQLELPPTPGTYELRYFLNQDREVVARREITVTAVPAEVTHAASAPAGTELQVGWSGPDYPSDYITVSRPGDDGYETFEYTRSGNPVMLELPEAPGDYEIRYVMNQDRTVIATSPFTVE